MSEYCAGCKTRQEEIERLKAELADAPDRVVMDWRADHDEEFAHCGIWRDKRTEAAERPSSEPEAQREPCGLTSGGTEVPQSPDRIEPGD